jgi:Flp pilus assembly protein TadD
MLVTLPFILLLLDYWPLNRFTLTSDKRPVLYQIIIEKIPFFAVSAISSIVAFLTQKTGSGVVDIETIPFTERVGDGFVYYIKYIGKMFWPQDLAIVYSHNIGNFAFWQIAICALLVIAVSILVIRFGRNQKYLPMGWFWFTGTLVPVIGLVRFMGAAGGSFADRFTYIPYIGLFIMIAWGLPELISKWRNRKLVLGTSMAIVLTTFGIYTHRQVSYWKNSLTVFSHALKVTQNNYVAYYGIGKAYDDMGRYREAVDAYKQVIRIRPNYAEAYNNLGNTYGRLGRYQESIDALGQAIKIKPHYADAYKNLGITYGEFGRCPEAIEAFKQAIKIEPDLAMAYNNLGIAYDELGRYKEAIEAYKQAIRIKPDYANAHAALSAAYFKTGNRDSALKEYEIVKTLNPEMANKLYNYIYKSDK